MKESLKKLLKKSLRKTADIYETALNPKQRQSTKIAEEGWSLVVITDGKSNPLLQKLIDSIKAELNNTPYEIIVVGPKQLDLSFVDKDIPLVHIVYTELKIPSVTGWITKKKNVGISASRYDKVVVCHDYIALLPEWKKGFDEFGDFEVCSTVMIDMDGERSTDWMTWDYPNIGQALVPYDKECTQFQYLCGIYFVAKRDFLLKNPQLENLRWGEAEDIEWSKVIRKKVKFRMNTKSSIQFSKPKWKLPEHIQEGSLKLKNLL